MPSGAGINSAYKSKAYSLTVVFMRRFGSVITYLCLLNLGRIVICGYVLALKPDGREIKVKKCRKYQGKF